MNWEWKYPLPAEVQRDLHGLFGTRHGAGAAGARGACFCFLGLAAGAVGESERADGEGEEGECFHSVLVCFYGFVCGIMPHDLSVTLKRRFYSRNFMR
jgi:hypothetical protein